MSDNLNVNGISKCKSLDSNKGLGALNEKIDINFNGRWHRVKERPLGYQNVDIEKANDIAQEFFNAMDGLGTDKEAMKKACEKLTKYNVLEVMEQFSKLESNKDNLTLMEFIRSDFSTYGGGTNLIQDDCKEVIDTFFKLLRARGEDKEKVCDNSRSLASGQGLNEIVEYFCDVKNLYRSDSGSSAVNYRAAQEEVNKEGSASIAERPFHWMMLFSDPTRATSKLALSLKALEESLFQGVQYDSYSGSHPELE